MSCKEQHAIWQLHILIFWFSTVLIQIFLSLTVVFICWVTLWVLKDFSDAHFLIMFQLTEFWLFLQSALIDAAVDIFSYTVCCIFWDMHSWSDSSCQTSCVWVETVSVLHSDTNQAERWMSLFSALKLRLHDKYQILFTNIYSECLLFWLQNFWKIFFCFSIFLIVLNVK